VIVETVRTYLEMASPADLRPAFDVPSLRLEPVANAAPLVRELVRRVGAPHHWSHALVSDQEWAARMAEPGLQHWVLTVDAEPAGVSGLQAHPGGEVEIVVFGLVPERVGCGYGGAALSETVRLAWTRLDAAVIRRVWLHTSSLDHPHALANYQRRGFRVYRSEISDPGCVAKTYPGFFTDLRRLA
jgi:GNAT superfamily N-acetyltransferase